MSVDLDDWSTFDADTGDRLKFDPLAGSTETCWQRARPLSASIERASRVGYRVALPDGDRHIVVLALDEGDYVGYCDCKAFEFNTGPCAHLCTIRKAAWAHVEDDRGNRVTIPRLDELGDATAEYPHLSFLTDRERDVYVATQIGDTGVRQWARDEDLSPGTASNLLRSARDRIEEHERELAAQGEPDSTRDGLTDDRRVAGEGVSR